MLGARTSTSKSNVTTITPELGSDYLDLSDYLLQMQFAEKITSIANNVDKIANKVAGATGSNKFNEIEIAGFTNL